MSFINRVGALRMCSGTGKSRLLDEISKEFLAISFVLRHPGKDGYPPGDHEITSFLTGPLTKTGTETGPSAVLHARAVALLAGSFAQCKD